MKTYNMNFIADKKEYWVSSAEKANFIVVFQDKSSAHQYKLSLTLGSTIGPWDSVENYTLISSKENQFFYQIEEIRNSSEWKDEACCQSGCPGCPWTIAQENN
jgi:hypothetical protein